MASTPNYFKGAIDDLRVYSRALTSSEVSTASSSYHDYVNLDPAYLGVGGSSSSAINLGSGQVGDWPFNGNAKDATPQADDGTVANATLTTDRKGRASSAYSFNGSTAAITLPTNTVLNNTTTTIAAWINPSGAGTNRTILGTGTAATGPQFRINTSDKLELLKQGSTSVGQSTGTISTSTWTHVAVTYNTSGNYVFYINGAASGSGTNAQTFTFSNYQIGTANSAQYFNGTLDDLRTWNRVLSAAEIKALYDGYR